MKEVLIFGWCVLAMIVHVWTCVATNWAAMLIIGLMCFPVGVVHGTGIILGFW
jgi:1,4-dihydroxy-2-naphthoate octaprenyltransferase